MKSMMPIVGRPFTPDDFRPGAPPVFVMEHKTWLDRFGAVGIGGECGRQDLDGHFTAEPRVPREVNFADASRALMRMGCSGARQESLRASVS